MGTSFLRFGIGPSGARYVLVRIPGTGIGFIKYLGQPLQRHAHSASPPSGTIPTPQMQPLPSASLTRNQEILRAIKRFSEQSRIKGLRTRVSGDKCDSIALRSRSSAAR
jgi:hypothetical protein